MALDPLPDDVSVFTCGPLPFMKAIRSNLVDRGVPAAHIQYEVFGPDLWRADLVTEAAPDVIVLPDVQGAPAEARV